MQNSGVFGFCDFREGGIEGVNLLKNALSKTGSAGVILGRDGGESYADGIGVSSTKEGGDVIQRAIETKKRGQIVAFHAGEKDSRDVDSALDAEPDMLVHCTHATDSQLKRIADMDVSIVVCPRSNWRLGVSWSSANPPIKKMLDYGCNVLLGTDNVMFVQPDMFSEMSFASYAYDIAPIDLLKMATKGSSFFNKPFYIEKGKPASFFTILPSCSNMRFSHSVQKTITNRMNKGDIERIYFKHIEK